MKEIGDQAEQVATDFLMAKKLKIIDRNWRAEGGELDIVARYKKEIHFVEVKCRAGGMNQAWLAVTASKQQRLQRTAQQWVLANGKDKWSYQFDVIGVSGSDVEWRQHVIDS